jgi:ABC-2 type transport system ATP-binding protein
MAESKIVVISTHLLEEVDAVCSRAVVIAHGRIVADDTPHGLQARSKFHNAVTFRLANGADLRSVRNAVAALPEVSAVEIDDKTGRITAFPAPERLPRGPVNRLAEQNGWDLAELELESGRLDEVFRSITGGASA